MNLMSHQNKDVLHALLMELLNHLWEVPKSRRVKGEYPAFICVVQVIPLHILVVKEAKSFQLKRGNDSLQGKAQLGCGNVVLTHSNVHRMFFTHSQSLSLMSTMA